MMPSDQQVTNEWSVAGAGTLLREAREARGLSTRQVAGELRLDVRYIEAMERDEYTQLVAPVFGRGYLRSYARFLNLSPDTIVTSYEHRKGPVPKALPRRSAFYDNTSDGNNRLHWIIYSIVLVSLIVGVIWWQMQGTVKFWEGRSLEDIEPELSDAPVAANLAPAKTANDTTVIQDTDQAKNTAVTAPPATPTVTDSVTSPIADAAPTTDTASAPAPAPVPAPVPVPQVTPAMPSVTLSLTADSWVDIIDAEGKHLIYETLSAGTTQTLQGIKLPLKVVLGKAANVSLDYNGKPFDHSRYHRDGMARFELGSASTNAPNN